MKKSIELSTRMETFVDTSGFFALLVKQDRMHGRARAIIDRAARSAGRFVTSDYVLDETATLLKARGHSHLTAALFDTVFASASCRIEWMDTERFEHVRRFFIKHLDQAWSFTDCFSFWIMRFFRLREAMTSDKHFRHAGFDALLV